MAADTADPTPALLDDALEAMWVDAAETFAGRVATIEDHVANLVTGHRDDALETEAISAAHRLAGTLGMFGMAAGSAMAAELERLFEAHGAPDFAQVERMAEIANELRADIEERSSTVGRQAAAIVSAGSPRVRLLGRERSFLEALRWAGGQRGLVVEHDDGGGAGDAEPADAVIVDAVGCADPGAVIAQAARAGIPMIVLSDTNEFARRAEYLRAGARRVISTSAPVALVLDLVEDLVAADAGGLSVAAIGVEAAETERLQAGFAAEGCVVAALPAPGDLGALVDTAAPDVVLVGADLDGLELVEALAVIDADPVWSSCLVVALVPTPDDVAMIAPRALSVGADDVVAVDRGWGTVARRVRLRAVRSMSGDRRRFGSSSDRVRLVTRLASFVADATAAERPASIAFLRVADLRDVNAGEGYEAGDQLLRRAERFLRTFFRAGDIVGPWTGGSFVAGLSMPRDVANRRLGAALDEMAQSGLACHGGVSSAPDDGTEIDALVAAAERRTARPVMAARDDGAGGRRIVVVEDDEVVSGLVRELLEAEDHRVEVFADGPAALPLLTDPDVFEQVALVLLDITLPGVDGFGVLRAMQRANTLERVPVVMLTARTLEEEVQAAMDLGAVDHVAKPFSPQVLLRRVERAMALVKT